jgi:NAD(P)-dependent dehydrogenase (short-subunit alcohol dehydrogenase family)
MTRAFGHSTTTDEVLEGIDLTGQVALVTGGSGGLGAETARALASKGAAVTLTARDVPKGEAVAEAIRAATPGAVVEVASLELGDPSSIHAFAEAWLPRHPKLNLLVNNAGIMACPLGRDARGFELQFATNHLGHFQLTGELLSALRAGTPARIVNLSSAGHRFGPVVFDDIHCERRAYDKWEAYGQAKTANVLFSVELDKRYGPEGIHAYGVHPGGIMTELGRHLEESDIAELMKRSPGGKPIEWKTVESGSATSVWACTAPSLEGRGGLYLEDCSEGVPRESEDQAGGVAAWALDPQAATQLWAESERMLGFSFPA